MGVGVVGSLAYLLSGGFGCLNIPKWALMVCYPGLMPTNAPAPVDAPASRRTAKRRLNAGVLLVLVSCVSGCQTTFRTVDARFVAQPAAHERVQILPVWFEGAGNLDHTLTTNELKRLCGEAGENLSTALQQTLQSKGYQIVGPVNVLSGDEEQWLLEPETRQQLEAVRIDFCDRLLRQYSAAADRPLTFRTNSALGFWRCLGPRHPGDEPNPFHCEMTPALTNLTARLGATNAEAVLLMDAKAFFESKHNRTRRVVWNATGGGLIATTEVAVNLAMIVMVGLGGGHASDGFWVDPFWYSDNSLQHNIALVDARTREVLWLNRRSFQHKDPRDAKVLAETVATTVNDLPWQQVW